MAMEVAAARSAMEADNILRARAEGHGRPVISTDFKGYRFVAVGKRMYYGKEWRFFTDFLLHHMKDVLGRGWGTRMAAQVGVHPLFDWLQQMNDLEARAEKPETGVFAVRGEGVAIGVFRFAYALYLIAHHDEIPATLIRRLRQPSEFLAAVVETIAFATFALAGFRIEMGETRKGVGPEGEFRATSAKAGKTFNVEAKRKNGWRNPVDVHDLAFRQELAVWLERKIRDASNKRLSDPIFWLELSIPGLSAIEEAEALQTLVREALRRAEGRIRIGGEVPPPAYVFVASHGYLAGGDDSSLYMLEGFHIPMRVKGEIVEIEQAMIERDRDRDVVWILDCLRKVQQIPHHFDGTPDDLVGPDRKPIERIRVGQRLEVTLPDAPSVSGLVTHVVSRGVTAAVVIVDEATGVQRIVEIPLSEDEQRAAAALGDAVFGNANGTEKLPEEDSLSLYDFFLKGYASTPREKLLEFVADHPNAAEFSSLPTEDLRIRVCREWTKSALSRHPHHGVQPSADENATGA